MLVVFMITNMKICTIFFAGFCAVAPIYANAATEKNDGREITVSTIDAIKIAGNMVESGDIENAETILTAIPPIGGPLEIERWFLLGRIATARGDIDSAITIYRKILDAQPELARIRFELALCYMHKNLWTRADYHLRLAMAGQDLDDDVRRMMSYYRWIVRQNKNWNVWFNFGAAPDNNINNATGGSECVNTPYGPMCRDLNDPESAIGVNLTLGGNYEFKLGQNWRWKSDANLYSNFYDKKKFNDLYLMGGTGPRYVWSRGDMWLAGTLGRRWYGGDPYYWTAGAKLDTNYDFTRKLSGGVQLRFMDNTYDDFGEYLDGQTYSAHAHASYSIDATKYLMLRGGVDREVTVNRTYANWRPGLSVGFGVELPWGFHTYIEPGVYWTRYDAPRWIVDGGNFIQRTERDFTQYYTIAISNNKFDVWGFVPTLSLTYTKRDSNIWQREYDKVSAEFTMRQRF